MNGTSGTPAPPDDRGQAHRTTLLYLLVAAIMVGLLFGVGVGALGFGDDGGASAELSTDDLNDQETAPPEDDSGEADDAEHVAGGDDHGEEEADEADGTGENDAADDDAEGEANEEDATEENDAADDDAEGEANEEDATEENDAADDDGDGQADEEDAAQEDEAGDEGDDETDEDGSDEHDADSNESAEDPSDEEIQAAFNGSISEVVNVTALETREVHGAENQTHLEYATDAENRSELKDEMRPIAIAFAEGVDQGWETDKLWADFVAEEYDMYGYFVVHEEWAAEWKDGEMSDEEFFQRVEDTLVTFPLMSDGE